MGLFGCRGCEAREKEIQHLLAQVAAQRDQTTKLTAQICEIVSPGAVRRAAPPPPIPATTARVRRAQEPASAPRTFPGYEPEAPEPTPEIS